MKKFAEFRSKQRSNYFHGIMSKQLCPSTSQTKMALQCVQSKTVFEERIITKVIKRQIIQTQFIAMVWTKYNKKITKRN